MTTIELKELACYLPALVDELPLKKESGSTDNLLLGDVLDHDDEVAGGGSQLVPPVLPLLPGG